MLRARPEPMSPISLSRKTSAINLANLVAQRRWRTINRRSVNMENKNPDALIAAVLEFVNMESRSIDALNVTVLPSVSTND